ncbi:MULTISPECIES: 1-deoxy-D-xylulose-5-phosphate synthase N-terminal domain-containing protein [Ensifer]|jgi:pyruvate dehydrogenase E1 component|uniref:1-deoxy-D-xylulose-5-phosphate synthase N-terminal domain-containing protein n=1 Tax=Ensifer TaxID=106591 RepID=UPI00071284B4|nr:MULTISPECIES: 1-deoxy-D-xylulose-5-phosphate synthase N-terminal domain-containing protein [Ensifer]KQX57145.1 transketolase [Ensifer sp. Root1298]KQX92453.1 transketolase [Ensifer sp. Root1312]KRC28323.1 transketolase [Ensifer sp. Root74]KRD79119.1 transketolase [Ensifer sp. Root954]UTV39912.1 transketolase [Ensifer adhaerens]
MTDTTHLKTIEKRLLWLSHWMIHHANHIRPKVDGIKTGGHQASCASVVSIMTALYFSALRPEDRVAVKPHAAPVFHAMHYLMGRQTREKLENFRGFGGAQSYPSRTKDVDDVDFSTGSVGLGVGITALASIVQDFVRAKQWGEGKIGRMVALVGDAELDEGNVYETLQEGWKNALRNCWWIIDYNRQSLDGIVREGLFERVEKIFDAFGWDVVRVKYGVLQRAAFAEPGGEKLRDWIDGCSNQDYAALTFMGGAVWRKRLADDLGDQGDVSALIERRSDAELSALMENLGGNCVETMAETFAAIDHDRPTCFLAYTIKGWSTPIAGHKDNHGGLMTTTQFAEWQAHMGVGRGEEWEPFAGVADRQALQAFLAAVPFFAEGIRRHAEHRLEVPPIAFETQREVSTQMAFGKILDDLAKGKSDLAERILTTSPDVTGTTSLGAWVNRRKLFARQPLADAFIEHRIPSTAKWEFTPEGQHVELGIAEMNLFLLLGAAGLSHSLFGKRLIPIGTVYDPFVCRGLDALNYACYQDARFMIVGTPSGVTLAPEGGAHQSIGTPLIGISQDGLAAFEPAFADELAVIMEWAFDYMQRDGDNDPDERTWLRDETGGSVYLRLTTKPLEQPLKRVDDDFGQGAIDGAYWLRKPGPNCDVVIAYQGAVADEAIAAAGLIGEVRRDIGVLAVTSADRLNAGWTAAQRERARGNPRAKSHIERLLDPLPGHCAIVTVLDGHPAALSWLGAVAGHRTIAHGVEHFGQTGTIGDLYRHFRLDRNALAASAMALTAGRRTAAGQAALLFP